MFILSSIDLNTSALLCGEKLCVVELTLIMIFFLFDVEILIKIETVNFLLFLLLMRWDQRFFIMSDLKHSVWNLSIKRYVQFEKIGCFSYSKLILKNLLDRISWNDGSVWRCLLFLGGYSRLSGGCRDKFYGCHFYQKLRWNR